MNRLRFVFVLIASTFIGAIIAAGCGGGNGSGGNGTTGNNGVHESLTYVGFVDFLAVFPSPTVVHFDDIITSGDEVVAFAADRYEAGFGIKISAPGGQYVSRTFSHPGELVPSSAPNQYAPGPIDGLGKVTTVTFKGPNGGPGLVASFGCTFIDADNFNQGPCIMTIYDKNGTSLNAVIVDQGPNGSSAFRGFGTFDVNGDPIPAIAKVVIQAGSGWPVNDDNESVTLDDFAYSAPVNQN
jgi:hypothetical protein